jgi:hypothetical protein
MKCVTRLGKNECIAMAKSKQRVKSEQFTNAYNLTGATSGLFLATPEKI